MPTGRTGTRGVPYESRTRYTFPETALGEALRIARGVVREGQAGDPISIEHGGMVIRQLVLTPEGVVEEALDG